MISSLEIFIPSIKGDVKHPYLLSLFSFSFRRRAASFCRLSTHPPVPLITFPFVPSFAWSTVILNPSFLPYWLPHLQPINRTRFKKLFYWLIVLFQLLPVTGWDFMCCKFNPQCYSVGSEAWLSSQKGTALGWVNVARVGSSQKQVRPRPLPSWLPSWDDAVQRPHSWAPQPPEPWAK